MNSVSITGYIFFLFINILHFRVQINLIGRILRGIASSFTWKCQHFFAQVPESSGFLFMWMSQTRWQLKLAITRLWYCIQLLIESSCEMWSWVISPALPLGNLLTVFAPGLTCWREFSFIYHGQGVVVFECFNLNVSKYLLIFFEVLLNLIDFGIFFEYFSISEIFSHGVVQGGKGP